MSHVSRKLVVAGAIIAAAAAYTWTGYAQAPAQAPAAPTGAAALPWVNMTPTNDLPSPYETIPDPFKLPDNRTWGATSAIDVDKDGKSIWVAERCGANSACLSNKVDPILHYDENGKLIKSFGAGKIVAPHGIFVDKDDNVWITQRPRSVNDRDKRAERGDKSICCYTAPSVIVFNQAGDVIKSWGGPKTAQGYDWPQNEHGMFVDYKGNVWLAGNGENDGMVLKFT